MTIISTSTTIAGIRDAAKKSFFLVFGPLRLGGGGKGEIKKEKIRSFFFEFLTV